MNKFQSLFLSLIAIFAITFTACENTDDTPEPPVAPTVFFSTGAGLVTSADTVQPLDTFMVEFNASSGNSALVSYSIYQDGVRIDDFDRVTVDGESFNANPSLLFGADTSSFTKQFAIVAHPEFNTTRTYNFEVMDANGETAAVAVDITTEEEVIIITTPLEDTLTGAFFVNASGPNADGGFDFSAGTAVSALGTDADIVDLGIDNGPVATNWIQRFRSANGAVLRVPMASFDYEAAGTKEAVMEAYDMATEITETAEKVQVGDMFFVKKDEIIYAMKITDVTVTADNNADRYTFEYKY
jgi:hypothetical protein